MKSHSTYKLLAAAVLFALLAVGCQKDAKEKVSVNVPSAGLLSFGITQNDGWSTPSTKAEGEPQTKGSSFRSEMLLMDCEDADSPLGDVFIYMVEEDIPAAEPQEEVATRAGGSDSAEGESAVVDSRTYGVFAYQGTYSDTVPTDYIPSDATAFGQIQNLMLDTDGKYECDDIYAPGAGYWLQFIAYAPYMEVAASAESTNNPALFSNGGYPSIRYEATSDLAKTTDLLFGGRRDANGKLTPICGDLNTTNDGKTPTVALNLSHILSKIRIDSRALAGTITSIKITGIKNSGIYNADNQMTWDLTGSDEQEYVYIGGTDNSEEYFLLPQELANDAKLEIKVVVPVPNSDPAQTREYTLTKNLKALVGQWAPNKQYTYTITTPHEVEVTVSDRIYYEGTYPVKTDLVIKNNGLADAYIRVALTGAWMVKDTNIGSDATVNLTVSDWKTDDGEFNWGTDQPRTGVTNSNSWRLGNDGYYYYMELVKPGETIKPLFESYKLTAPAPTGGAFLAFTILAQGVYAADAQYLFDSDIWNELK